MRRPGSKDGTLTPGQRPFETALDFPPRGRVRLTLPDLSIPSGGSLQAPSLLIPSPLRGHFTGSPLVFGLRSQAWASGDHLSCSLSSQMSSVTGCDPTSQRGGAGRAPGLSRTEVSQGR